MLILPTSSGFYELTNTMDNGSNLLLSDYSGRILLSRYGIHGHRKKLILLYFFNYYANYIQTMITSYLENNISSNTILMNSLGIDSNQDNKKNPSNKNTPSSLSTQNKLSMGRSSFTNNQGPKKPTTIPTIASSSSSSVSKAVNIKDLPVHSMLPEKMPWTKLWEDPIQTSLLAIARLQYSRQRKETNEFYEDLGNKYRKEQVSIVAAAINKQMIAKALIEQEHKEAVRRIQSQVRYPYLLIILDYNNKSFLYTINESCLCLGHCLSYTILSVLKYPCLKGS